MKTFQYSPSSSVHIAHECVPLGQITKPTNGCQETLESAPGALIVRIRVTSRLDVGVAAPATYADVEIMTTDVQLILQSAQFTITIRSVDLFTICVTRTAFNPSRYLCCCCRFYPKVAFKALRFYSVCHVTLVRILANSEAENHSCLNRRVRLLFHLMFD